MAAPTIQEYRDIVRRNLLKCARQFESTMIRTKLTGGTTNTRLAVRTGQLRRSLGHKLNVLGDGNIFKLFVFIGGGVPYARIHEEGGIIRKKAKKLAIPVGKSLSRAGVATMGGPRNSSVPLMVLKSKKPGVSLLVAAKLVEAKAKKAGKKLGKGRVRLVPKLKGGKLDVRFILVDKVTIPARMGFERTFNFTAEKCMRKIQRRGRVIRLPRSG